MVRILSLDQWWYCSPEFIHLSQHSHHPFIFPSLLLPPLLPSLPLPFCLCVSVPVAGQCWYVLMFTACAWTFVRQTINLRFAGGRKITVHEAFLHGTMFSGCILFDTVSNPASPPVRLQECCEHSGSLPLSISLCFLCVLTEDWPSCSSLTDCLISSVVQCNAVFGWVSPLFCLSSLGTLSSLLVEALCEQEALQHCFCFFSLCLSVSPPIRLSGASWTMEMQSVPKTAWVFLTLHTNSSCPPLTYCPLTGWQIQVIHGYIHPPALSEEMRTVQIVMMIIPAASFLKRFLNVTKV